MSSPESSACRSKTGTGGGGFAFHAAAITSTMFISSPRLPSPPRTKTGGGGFHVHAGALAGMPSGRSGHNSGTVGGGLGSAYEPRRSSSCGGTGGGDLSVGMAAEGEFGVALAGVHEGGGNGGVGLANAIASSAAGRGEGKSGMPKSPKTRTPQRACAFRQACMCQSLDA